MCQPNINKTLFYGFDSTVHHIGWCYLQSASAPDVTNAIGPCFGIVDCDFCKSCNGGRIINGPIFIEDPTMSVIRVFTETNICGHKEAGELLSYQFDGLDNWPFGVISQRADAILLLDYMYTEENN